MYITFSSINQDDDHEPDDNILNRNTFDSIKYKTTPNTNNDTV